MRQYKFITGADLMAIIAKAIGLDDSTVRRVILDIPYDDVITVYTESIGDERLLKIDYSGIKCGLEIKEDDK